MAVAQKHDPQPFTITPERRAELVRLATEMDALAGITGPSTMTAEELQAYQRASGVRAEDNGATRELLRMRYGDDDRQR